MNNKVAIIILIGFLVSSCSGNFPEEKVRDINSGKYQLSGTQIKETYEFPWYGDEILSSDTTQIEFTVEVKCPEGRQDTVRFIGLEGADVGEHHAVVPCNVDPHLIPQCLAFAKLTGTKLTFDLAGFGGYYDGYGFLGAEILILETHFRYRSVGIYYELQGKKTK